MSEFFYNNLQGIAAKYGLSYRAIAMKAGVSGSTLTRYLQQGPHAPITKRTMKAVAEAFDLPAEQIDSELLIANPLKEEQEDARHDARFKARRAKEFIAIGAQYARQGMVIAIQESDVLNVETYLSDDETAEYFPPPIGFPQDYIYTMYAFQTSDDGLAPMIPPGAYVYARVIDEEHPPKIGDYVVAVPTEAEGEKNPAILGHPVLRQYVISMGEGQYVLRKLKDEVGIINPELRGVIEAWTVIAHE